MHAGMSGHILIHDSGNRLHSYDVLEFSPGHDAFYSPMIVDLTQPRHTVHYSCCHFGEIKFIYLVVTEPVHCCLVFRIPGTFPTNHFDHFYQPHTMSFYRAMLCIRGTGHGHVSVCSSVCASQVGVLSKRLNESSWFLARELPSTRPTLY